MDQHELRLLIGQKLADGRLPHNSIPRIWGGPSHDEKCHACDETIALPGLVTSGPVTSPGQVFTFEQSGSAASNRQELWIERDQAAIFLRVFCGSS
jgi:hypothetical protein